MKNKIRTYLYLIALIQLSPLTVFSQYLGGDADGYAVNTLIQSACGPLENTNIFSGGNADGYAMNALTQSVCGSHENTNIFFGGNADGFAKNSLTQAICAPMENTNVFFGGIADGGGINALAQSVCPDNPLPVQLLSWQALCDQKKVILRWTTGSESNNDYFSIEKSSDANHWVLMGKITGAGNSDKALNYVFKDAQPSDETTYYRLKQTDVNGRYEYSKIISANCGTNASSNITIYPNPSQGKFIVEGLQSETTKDIKVYNYIGEIIWESETTQGFTEIDLYHQAKGVYFIQISDEGINSTHKIIIE